MQKQTLVVSIVGLFLVAASIATSFTPGASVQALTNCSTTEDRINAAEQQMLELINQARAQAGVPPLKFSPNLNRAAAWKSADGGSNGLGGVLSHYDSLGRSAVPRGRDCGYASGMAENVAYGTSNPSAILGMWMKSPGHRANILMASYKVIGIGQHNSAWTADFGNLDDSGATPPPPTPTPLPRVISGISVSLSAGLNLVTYGGEYQPVAAALFSLGGNVVAAYEWDSQALRWEKYAPGSPGYVNTFSAFTPGGVYYLELKSGGTWAY